MKEEKTFTGLYFGALPDLNELMSCLIEEEDEGSVLQPLGCRELLFTDPRFLLSPCLECGHQAFIIFKKPVLGCPKFQALMKKLKFKIVKEVIITTELLQYCLAFTLTQKLAPLWNKVGEYYVQGRDFLENANKLNAVTLDVSIREDRLCIGLKAFNVRLRLSQPDHFCSSPNVLQHFFAQKEATIKEHSIQDCLCFVFPSLKKAKVIGISHQIPPHCPFSCYEDLRKHWKLMYGYRLPANESVFYSVKFCHFKSKIFTYPSSCIRSAAPQVSPRCDQQAIFHAFLQDVQNRSPVICESALKLTSSPLYCSNNLYSASNGNQSSLTRAHPDFKPCTPFVVASNKQNHPFGQGRTNDVNNDATSDVTNSIEKPTHNAYDNTVITRQDGPRFVPSFTKNTSQSKNSKAGKNCLEITSSVPKANLSTSVIRPVFKANKVLSKAVETDGSSSHKIQNYNQATSSRHTLQRRLPPKAHTGFSLPSGQPKTMAQDAPCAKKLPEVRPGLILIRGSQARADMQNSAITGLVRNSTNDKMASKLHYTSTAVTNVNDSLRKQTMPSSRVGANAIHNCRIPQALVETNLNNKEPPKRKNSALENAVVQIKKPRLKPKIQEDIDVKQFALANQLNKVNSSTLIDWLKKHNVPVKQKDKKAELMDKVMNFIKSNNAQS